MSKSRSNPEKVIAIMGVTGTGKSTLIHLLTNDENIHIGHDLESKTLDIATARYVDEEAGIRVTLVDTPGFDDSREGVSDTDILGKIADFLQDKGGRKLNGIIYLHRISDPRFGGVARKNLRVFRELCGDKNLGHVRFVTTYWNVTTEQEGNDREMALASSIFKPFIDAGAGLVRHDGGFESAKNIISDLARKPPVRMKIQEELNAGMALGDTSAGAVIVEEMKELQKKHAKEMEELKKELEEAANENDDDLRAELDEERRKLAERIAQVQEDRRRLAITRMPLVTEPNSERPNDRNRDKRSEGEGQITVQKGRAPDSERPNDRNRDKRNGGEGQATVQKGRAPDSERPNDSSRDKRNGGEGQATVQKGRVPDSERSNDSSRDKRSGGEGQATVQKGRAPDSERPNDRNRDKRSGGEGQAAMQNAPSGEERRDGEDQSLPAPPVRHPLQNAANVNGERAPAGPDRGIFARFMSWWRRIWNMS